METVHHLDTETLNALQQLIRVNLDSAKNYREAANHVASVDLVDLFEGVSRVRAKHAVELRAHVRGNDVQPEVEGTLVGTLRRWWLELRAWANDGDPAAVLSEVERGEDVIKKAYEALLRDVTVKPLSNLLHRQFAEILVTHDQMHQLRDSWAKKPVSYLRPQSGDTMEAAQQPRVLLTTVFDNLADATNACEDLVAQGVPRTDLSAVLAGDVGPDGPTPDESKALVEPPESRASSSGRLGAVIGATAMGIAATALALPGILAVGPLAALLAGAGVGAVSGGALGSLIGIGVSRDIAEVYHRSLEGGAVMIGVEIDGAGRPQVESILTRHGGRSIHAVSFSG